MQTKARQFALVPMTVMQGDDKGGIVTEADELFSL